MINGFLCTNLFSKNPGMLINFYHNKLGIPIINVIVDELDGVNLGFSESAPTICIWDANKWGAPVCGTTSFVFTSTDLDTACDELKNNGLAIDSPVRFEWGTYELRLKDPDGNEIVIVEIQS